MSNLEMMAGDERDVEPLSPTSQYFSTSALSVCIIAAFEMEIRFEDSKAIELVQKLFLPINTRFSSLMVTDSNGLQQYWKKVKIKIEDHVISPIFPKDLSLESYEERIEDYISNLSMNPFSESRPLWELHNIKYPTTKCDGTVVFKLHHSLGDGFSLMGALFSRLRRADNPSLPLTFPHSRKKSLDTTKDQLLGNIYSTISSFFSTSFNTAGDFLSGLMKSNFLEDDISPIRSTTYGVELLPVKISTLTFPLDSIQQIKSKIRGTVNDVIVGIISYGTRLYIEKMSYGGECNVKNLTAVVLLNTRAIKGYQTTDEMNDPKKKSWGNQFGFLQISIPNSQDDDHQITSPLDFVFKTKEIIIRKRRSLAVYLTGGLLDMLRRFEGPEAAGRYIASTLRNTSFGISNLIGPLEKMEIGGHPVKSFYFSVVGTPQSLGFSVVSYMGELKVAVCAEKKLINSELLVSCVDVAFRKIFEEAVVYNED